MSSADRHLRGLARGGSLGLLGSVVNAGATFALVIAVTSTYDPATAGYFFTATSFFLLALAVVTLGSDTGLGRFVLRFEAHGRRADIPAAVRAGLVPPVVVATLAAVVCVVAAEPLSGLVGLDGASGPQVFALVGGVLPLVTIGFLALAGTRAFGRMRTTVLADSVVRPVGQLAAVWALGLLGAGLVAVVTGWLVGYLVATLIGLVAFHRLLRRHMDSPATGIQRAPQAAAVTWREYWKFTWARGIATVAQVALQRLDILLIAVMLGPVEAAVYTAATRFVALGKFPATAIQQVLQPRFTRLLAEEEDHGALREVYRISTAWSMAVSWPVYVVIGCAPLVYLSLFGETYQDGGVATVLWLTVAMMVSLAAGPADTLLLMSGRSVASLVNTLVALAIDVVGCLLLIPRFGITGAAAAWAVAVCTRSLVCLVLVRSDTRVSSVGPATWWVVGANAVAFAAPVLVLTQVAELSVLTLVLVVAGLSIPYVLALRLGRRALRLDVLVASLRRRRSGDA